MFIYSFSCYLIYSIWTYFSAFGSPPTPPSSTSSDADSEGNLSPEHEILAPASTNTTNTTSRRPQHTGTRLYHQNHSTHTTRQPIHTPLISSQPVSNLFLFSIKWFLYISLCCKCVQHVWNRQYWSKLKKLLTNVAGPIFIYYQIIHF